MTAWLDTVVPLISANNPSAPLWYYLGWIKVESGGRLDDKTSLGEVGYFQISPAEAADHGYDLDRIHNDAEYSISVGLQLINFYLNLADSEGFDTNTEFGLRIAKLYHTIGHGGSKAVFASMRADGIEPDSWEVIEQYVETHDHSKFVWFDLIDRLVKQGHILENEVNLRGLTPIKNESDYADSPESGFSDITLLVVIVVAAVGMWTVLA